MLKPVADQRELRNAFGCFPTGVTAVCALIEGLPAGMAANSFTSVSLDPPLVSICVQNSSETWRKLRWAPRLGVSILAAGHDMTCRRLAAKSGDRFLDVVWHATDEGAIFIDAASAWLDCAIDRCIEAGDHEIALLRVEQLRFHPDVTPLVFHASQFRQLADR